MITYQDTIFAANLKALLEENRKKILENIGTIPDYSHLRYHVGYLQCIKDIEIMADDLSRKLKGEK